MQLNRITGELFLTYLPSNEKRLTKADKKGWRENVFP